MLKKLLKIIAILLALVIIVAIGYVAYVFLAYHRLPDEDVVVPAESEDAEEVKLATGKEYSILTWNLGFGAYSADYSFFMDGGTESRAFSKEAVLENIGHAVDVINGQNPDFGILQEIDIGSTRSYQVDQAALIGESVPGYSYFAQNYDSPYLFYPITQPHGASKSGLLTLSDYWIARRVRRSLPVEKGFMKLLDLDRCYSKSYVAVENGKNLVLFNVHLSAYTSDGRIAQEQLELLCADMLEEYRAGNYVVGGGDFNKDLPGNSGEVFGVSGAEYSWNQPIPEGTIPVGLTLVDALDEDNPVPSNRIADAPYRKGVTFVNLLDGFIVSDNVKVNSCRVIDDGFKCSDHNPVVLTFELAE